MTPFFRYLLMVVTFASASGFVINDRKDVDQLQPSYQHVPEHFPELPRQLCDSTVREVHRNVTQIPAELPCNAISPFMNIRWDGWAPRSEPFCRAAHTHRQTCTAKRPSASNSFEEMNSVTSFKGPSPDVRRQHVQSAVFSFASGSVIVPYRSEVSSDQMCSDCIQYQTCTARRTSVSISFDRVNSLSSCQSHSSDIHQRTQCPNPCLIDAEASMPSTNDADRTQEFCSFTSFTQFWPVFTFHQNSLFCDSSWPSTSSVDLGQQHPDPITWQDKSTSSNEQRMHETSPDSTFCHQAPAAEVCRATTSGRYLISIETHNPL